MKNQPCFNSVSQKIRELWGFEVLPKMHGGLWEKFWGLFYDGSIWKNGRGAFLDPTGSLQEAVGAAKMRYDVPFSRYS